MQSLTNPAEGTLSEQERAIVRMIRARVSLGESIVNISTTSGISYALIRRLSCEVGIRYKHKRPTPEQIRGAIAAVRDKGMTVRAAGRLFGMSKTAAHRYVTKVREKSIDQAGEVVFEDGHRTYAPVKKSWNCPTHGRITVWPCVACAALAAKHS